MSKKVIFITGVSSGIGREIVKQLVGAGHSVHGCARREEKLKSLESELKNSSGSFSYSICDVRSREQIDSAVNVALEMYKKIDIVFANAGFGIGGRFQKLNTDDFRRQFDTNVFGVIDTVHSCLDQIIENKGSIVLMGSANSHVSEPKKTPYCMSKFAIKALADGLFWEMKPLGVSVTLISPGIVDSEIRQVDKFGVFNPEAKDPAPKKLIVSAGAAARQIIEAIFSRKKEKLITVHGAVAVYANRFAPFLLRPILMQSKPKSRSEKNQ